MITFCFDVIGILCFLDVPEAKYKAAKLCTAFFQFIRFCIWNGNVQEDAPNWASYNAQLTSKALELPYFVSSFPLCSSNEYAACEYVVLNYVNGSSNLQPS